MLLLKLANGAISVLEADMVSVSVCDVLRWSSTSSTVSLMMLLVRII